MMLMLDICVAIYWRNIWLISFSIFVEEVFKVNIHVFYFFGQVLSATLDKRIILSHADGEIINWKLTHYYGKGPFKSHESLKQLDPRVNHTAHWHSQGLNMKGCRSILPWSWQGSWQSSWLSWFLGTVRRQRDHSYIFIRCFGSKFDVVCA
jgi:hypothetical protein